MSFSFQPDREAYIRYTGTDQLTPRAILFALSVPVGVSVLTFTLGFSDFICLSVLSISVVFVLLAAVPYSRYLAGKVFDESPVLSVPMKLHFNGTGFILVTKVRSDLEDPHYAASWLVVSDELVLMQRQQLAEKVVPIRISDIEDGDVRNQFLQCIENDGFTGNLTPPAGWGLCRNCGEFTRNDDMVAGQQACTDCRDTYHQRLREGVTTERHRSKIGRFSLPILFAVIDAGMVAVAFGIGQSFGYSGVAPWSRPFDRVTNEAFIGCLAFNGFTVAIFLITLVIWRTVKRDDRMTDHPLLTPLLLWTGLLAIVGCLPPLLF